MQESRTKNSVLNLVAALAGQGINIVLNFAVRTIFIRTLSTEYLGLNGLFTNILSFLSLAELGVGSAITFCLYKPIAEQNEEEISILMNLFKRAYIIVGAVVLIVGIGLTPFLHLFIAEMPKGIPNISLIYILFVVNSGISYFCSYKAIYVIANQKNYIVTNNKFLFRIIVAILQILVLVLFKDYITYLVIKVVGTLFENVSITIIANKKYPVLKKKTTKKLNAETQNVIVANIKAVFVNRIGSVIITSTDNILLSKIFGLGIVGLYSNYSLLIVTVEGLLSRFFTAITASVGNMSVATSKEKQNDIYELINFIQFWMYSFSTVAFAALFNSFIELWIGKEYLIDTLCMVFAIANFYINGMRQSNIVFNTTYGLARYYTWLPIPTALFNLFSSIGLAFIIGPAGVFAGTTLSTLCTSFWMEPWMLMKRGLHGSLKKYWINYSKYTLTTLISLGVTFYLCNLIVENGIFGFVLKMLIVMIVPNVAICILYHKTSEFKYLLGMLQKILNKKDKRSL